MMKSHQEKLFTKKILGWGKKTDRQLPWKQTNDPYLIWLSEVILQQTRVDQGMAYYLKFSERFPDIFSLASADEDLVLRLWKGLGYYARARNMMKTAREIVEKHNGLFPADYEALGNLKGIGPYTAAAIASFAFNIPRAVVDGNVLRVLARFFGIDLPIDTGAGKKAFQALADRLIDRAQPGNYNQAIMDFGALVCTPRSPGCTGCMLRHDCSSYRQNKVAQRPVKQKKPARRSRFFNYLVFSNDQFILLNKRTGNDIWQSLYDFPMIETGDKLSTNPESFLKNGLNGFPVSNLTILNDSGYLKQDLTHQRIYARFIRLPWNGQVAEKYLKIQWPLISTFAYPKIVDEYIKNSLINLSLEH